VVDIDLKSFFDEVNHDRLMRLVGQKVRDKRLLRLIADYPILRYSRIKSSIFGGVTALPPCICRGECFQTACGADLVH
jgi:hypothetical protein